MKKILITLSLGLLCLTINQSANAQTNLKEATKELKGKAVKDARKEAKKWEKQGYTNLPGDAPLSKQFERSMAMQYILDDEGNNRYISAFGSALAGTSGVASANAMDNTRLALAGQIQSEVSALISNNKANTQLNTEEVETVDEFIANSKTLIQTQLGAVKPAIRMYKMNENKTVEYRYTVLYDLKNAKRITKNLMKKELEGKLKSNEEDLDQLLGL